MGLLFMESYELSTKESIFGLIFILVLYLITRVLFILLVGFFMFPYIVRSIFRTRNYNYRMYYPIIFAVLLIQRLILTYIYLFKSLYLTNIGSYTFFYIEIGLFIFLSVAYAHFYRHKHIYSKIP